MSNIRIFSKIINGLPIVVGLGATLSADAQQQPNPLPANYNSSIKVNYVRSWDATAPDTNRASLIARPLKDVKQATQLILTAWAGRFRLL